MAESPTPRKASELLVGPPEIVKAQVVAVINRNRRLHLGQYPASFVHKMGWIDLVRLEGDPNLLKREEVLMGIALFNVCLGEAIHLKSLPMEERAYWEQQRDEWDMKRPGAVRDITSPTSVETFMQLQALCELFPET